MRLIKSSWLLLACLVGMVLLVACGDDTATTAPAPAAVPPTTAVSVTVAPTTAASAATTAAAKTTAAGTSTGASAAPRPTQSDPVAEAGRLVFAKTCAGCHAGEGTLASNRAPQLSVSQNAINADFVRNQVRNGKGKMPAFPASKVSDADLENIIVYLKAIHTS